MDSVETIAELTRKWGDDPDRLYGKNLKDYARTMAPRPVRLMTNLLAGGGENAFYASYRQLCKVSKPSEELLALVKEVADALRMDMPACVHISNTANVLDTFALPATGELYISNIALEILNGEELKALIAHEMHHFQQNYYGTAKSEVIDTVGILLEEVAQWTRRNNIPGNLAFGKVFDRYIDWRIESRVKVEFEADSVAVQVTSPSARKNGLKKTLSHHFHLNIDSISTEEFLEKVNDRYKGLHDRLRYSLGRIHYFYGGKHNVSERFANIERCGRSLE